MSTPWYREFFGEDYLRMYCPRLTDDVSAGQVEQIAAVLNLPEGSSILDLCCGHGRHAIPLALRGYRVTGLDLSPVFLDRARADAGARGADVRWVEADMREIPFEAEFDAAINMFTAFGYLESDEEDAQVVEAVHRALKPGGRFLLETLHRDNVLRRLERAGVERHEDGLIVIEEREFDVTTSRMPVVVTLLHPDGRRSEYGHAVRMYTAAELGKMFRAAGFEVEALYGGLDGSPLTLQSRRLAVLGRDQGRRSGPSARKRCWPLPGGWSPGGGPPGSGRPDPRLG
jgi:SAM-dependent methyltransferase